MASKIDPDLASLYRGTVMHHRKRPVDHRFTYKVFSLLLDIDRLADIDTKLKLLAIDHFGFLAFHRRDHGPRDGGDLRPWVEAQLRQASQPDTPKRIMLLSMPRLVGYIFNPLSVYFCYDGNDELETVVYQVKNTFGGQHIYVLAAPKTNGARAISHGCTKEFFVSPFIDMNANYHFRLREPDDRLTMAIRETDETGCFFVASHTAKRHSLSDMSLFKCLLSHGFLGIKVMAGIHFEALRLWLKGAPYFSRDVKQT